MNLWLIIFGVFMIALFATALMGLHAAENRPFRSACWALIALGGWGAVVVMVPHS